MRRKKESAPAATGTTAKDTTQVIEKEELDLKNLLQKAEHEAIGLLEATLEAVKRLADIRIQCKLSNSRVSGVARELKELIKVMSVYK